MKLPKAFFILVPLLISVFYIPISLYGSSQFKPSFFNGELYLSSIPRVSQSAVMKLDLTAIAGNCEKTTIKFRTPSGISMLGQSVFEESSFSKGLSRTYSAEIKVLEEGIYALQASVYFLLADGHSAVEHFFKFLIVDKYGSKLVNNVESLTVSKNGIEVQTRILPAPPNFLTAKGTFELYGRVTYYDDNLSKPVPIRRVTVKLFEVLQESYKLIDTQYTDNDGSYIFSDINNDPERNFQIKVSFENDVLKIIDNNNDFYEFDLPLINNILGDSVNSDCFFNETNQHRVLGHIFNSIMDAYDFLQSNLNWSRKLIIVKYPYESDNTVSKYSYSSLYPLNNRIFNELIQIAVGRQWNRTSMLHEYGHAVMTALFDYNIVNLPKSQFKGDPDANYTHSVYTVSDTGFAMKEGWAEFFEALVDDNAFNTTQYGNANTPNIEYNSWWKLINEKNDHGELVEGAVASILWDIADTARSKDEKPDVDDDKIDGKLKELWNLMMSYKPVSILELWDYWIKLNYGKVQSLYSIFTSNGVKVFMPYDVNGDGKIDIADIMMVGSYLGQTVTGTTQFNPDINRDGKVDVMDILMIGKNMAP
jgi:hypothetical protein